MAEEATEGGVGLGVLGGGRGWERARQRLDGHRRLVASRSEISFFWLELSFSEAPSNRQQAVLLCNLHCSRTTLDAETGHLVAGTIMRLHNRERVFSWSISYVQP